MHLWEVYFMEKNKKKEKKNEMPMGLGFGLAGNEEAMQHFTNLTDVEKKQVIETARMVQSKKEMNSLIQSIAKM